MEEQAKKIKKLVIGELVTSIVFTIVYGFACFVMLIVYGFATVIAAIVAGAAGSEEKVDMPIEGQIIITVLFILAILTLVMMVLSIVALVLTYMMGNDTTIAAMTAPCHVNTTFIPIDARKLPIAEFFPKMMSNWKELYAELDPEHRQIFWRKLIRKISVSQQGQGVAVLY